MRTYRQAFHISLTHDNRGSSNVNQLKKTVDNRPETIQQKQLLDIINGGVKVAQCAILKLPNPADPASTWEVDTRKEGREHIKSWIDAQIERKNYLAVKELMRQLRGISSPDEFEIFLYRYAGLVLGESHAERERVTIDAGGGQGKSEKNVPWLIFGTDGKDLNALKSAISKGYRRFDCAEGYNNINLVVRALKEEGIPRNEFEIIYKFDLKPGEEEADTSDRLLRVVKMFEEWLDVLIIHNATTDNEQMVAAWKIMNRLKSENLVGKVGVGNINANQADLLKKLSLAGRIDVVENSATSVLLEGQVLQKLIQNLGADLIYYDIVRLAGELGFFKKSNTPKENKVAIERLVFYLQEISHVPGFKSHMILSSRAPERQQSNLENFGSGSSRFNTPKDDDSLKESISYRSSFRKICKVNGPEVTLPSAVKNFLTTTDWNLLREKIAESGEEVLEYLQSQNLCDTELLKTITVPQREGLISQFVGWSLSYILEQFLKGVTCWYQECQELISVFVNTIDEWNFIKMHLEKVVVPIPE